MNPAPLDVLLEKLNGGDAAAVEQAFLAYEPFLRLVVRRQLPPALRARLDSADVVQSAWADLVVGFREAGWRFPDANHLRAFLVKVTCNRLRDRLRQSRASLQRTQPLDEASPEQLPATAQPRPSEHAQAAECWERLLELCPPEHHEVLRLRRDGLTRGEIAARTGLHEGSVRRILRRLAREAAFPAAADAVP
jgi:RNA polymerase sigma-70 factor (ECF subfamily)